MYSPLPPIFLNIKLCQIVKAPNPSLQKHGTAFALFGTETVFRKQDHLEKISLKEERGK
jgi:hypothetical protein